MRSAFLILCLLSPAGAEVTTAADPFVKLPEGKTVVWSPLFQATWDALNTEMGGKPEKIVPPNELMERLDSFEWKPDAVMPEGSWKTWAGEATPEFLAVVNREAAEMTGEERGPFTLQDPSAGTLVGFGLLDREVEFRKEFHESKKRALGFKTRSGIENVSFFGTKGALSSKYHDSVKVLFHFVFLWREQAEWPYLGVWIGDASALRKF